jgi:hypothetical protein
MAEKKFTDLPELYTAAADPDWLSKWAKYSERASKVVKEITTWSEPLIAREISQHLPDGASLFIASSRPIRDIEAFGAARKAGAKDFMWKGKKYAVQMAPKQAATPSPAGTVKNAAGGQTTTNAGGAATSVTRNSRPVVPGSLRAQQQANQAAQPATESYMKDLNAMRRIAGLKDSGT